MNNDKPAVRIDWFDGTVIEEPRHVIPTTSGFADEEVFVEPKATQPPSDKRLMGFKKLLDLSHLDASLLTLELSNKSSFWNLLNNELKGDFIVLIVKILAKLYKALEPEGSSLLKTLLRTKFEKSKFLNNLKEYISGLSKVRIMEKRMNSHLWDDVESFYYNVLILCKGMLNIGCNEVEYLRNIQDFLALIESSIIAVQQEHTERFSDNLFIELEELKTQVEIHLTKESTGNHSSSSPKCYEDINNFKNLDIFPTKNDLLGKSNVKIQPNIINGAYPSIEHYLDLQFKLLREDCFGPLREGICKYMQNPSKTRHENIRVHPKVRIIRTYVTNNKVGHLVDIAWKVRAVNQGLVNCKKYAYNKQLMFGSLLLFTSDNFEKILCATVLDSNMNLLSEGYIAVSFQNPVSNKIFSEAYLMVESEVFFEPYHRVLRVLQTAKIDNMPMRKYIVDVKPETKPPGYLTSDTMYTIQGSEKNQEISFPVLNIDKYPSSDLKLDYSQIEAFKFALTREFAVIQGPPGTGKTFLGIKIATTLLRNISLEGTPMLVICYTNHALDQFLEGILNVTNNIVRLGSQSKNKALESYTLNSMRTKTKSRYSYLYSSKRAELETIFKQMSEVQGEIEKCEKEILSYKSIKTSLKIGTKLYELESSKEDPVLNWLFSHLEEEFEQSNEETKLDDWERQLDELNIDEDKLVTCFSEKWSQKEIDSMLNSIKYVTDVTDDHLEGQKMADRFQSHIHRVRKRLSDFKKYSYLNQENNEGSEIVISSDLYSLTPEQKWRVYWTVVNNIRSVLMSKMNTLLEQHTACSEELNEVATLIDGEVMKTARVVGVTTTTAARRNDLMKKLLSPIVIVEEAAEVLEAHIVASLTHHCQHLILIGDHKQLRPTAAHYKLANDYNLEISLFERMIRNGVHAKSLTIQRRMRPNMVELLVPFIYEKLDSHPIVKDYPDVRGMKNNLYFYTHDVLEDSDNPEDSWSHKNTLEAKWCIAVANYLRVIKYKPEEITILATYTGQATLIKELSKRYSLLRDIKITVVDNYQGEENKIVILSLVRSNREGKIGFLKDVNRICVGLSRAKEGFYMFGNMNLLKKASSAWRFINDRLTTQNAIGRKFTVRCDTHKENILEIINPDDFDNCVVGSCLTICQK